MPNILLCGKLLHSCPENFDSSPENPHPGSSELSSSALSMLPPRNICDANIMLQECIESGDLDRIDTILSPLRDPETPELLVPDAREHLHRCVSVAMKAGYLSLAWKLLDHGIHIDSWTASFAVAHSLETGRTAMLEILLDHGWETERIFNYTHGSTSKSLYHNESLVKWLLAHGADPNAAYWLGLPASQFAQYAPLSMMKLLVDHGLRVQSTDSIVYAAIGHTNGEPERLEVVSYLLSLGAPINAWDCQFCDWEKCMSMISMKGGLTALHHAAKAGNTDMAVLLLQAGADKSRQAWNKKTALDLAMENGHEEMIALLRD